MAEEIQKKKISELPSAVYLSDEDVMPVVQGSGSSEATKKADIGLVGSTVAESKTFSNLDTTSKTLVGAINEVNSSIGNVPSADEISYDNTSSGLSASDVQGAIDEIAQGGSGGSTVTVTQIQSTGTKIATITVDSVSTDVYAPNGGGAGGHTIVDNAGTSLAQRTKLQFLGAYSEDNSTDDTTEVNVVREMTKAEFDLLTDEEKEGLINITDITGGNDDRFQPVIYSEEEREIGVWTDGKPLYQKTVILTNITIAVSGGYSYDISSWNVDTIVKNPEGFVTLSNETDLRTVPFGVLGNYATDITSTRSAIQFLRKGGDLTCNRVVFTLTYTKTTDTPGSGQWTPQGVPAHHYSEDEQVVGTWIDGKTLYEKTVSFTTVNTSNYTQQSLGLLTSEIDTIFVQSGYVSKGENITSWGIYTSSVLPEQSVGFIYKGATNISFDYRVGSSYFEGSSNLTIRYTKSST